MTGPLTVIRTAHRDSGRTSSAHRGLSPGHLEPVSETSMAAVHNGRVAPGLILNNARVLRGALLETSFLAASFPYFQF